MDEQERRLKSRLSVCQYIFYGAMIAVPAGVDFRVGQMWMLAAEVVFVLAFTAGLVTVFELRKIRDARPEPPHSFLHLK